MIEDAAWFEAACRRWVMSQASQMPEPTIRQLTEAWRICKACFLARVLADNDWIQTHDLVDIVPPEECAADEHAEASDANPHD